jgi:hypothetical protein
MERNGIAEAIPTFKQGVRSPASEIERSEIEQAGDRSRTGYLNLGKVALYQVSYARAESDSRV